MRFYRYLFLALFLLGGCQQKALLVYQQTITPAYLASTNVGSPDPRKPPKGQMLIAEWWIPRSILQECPVLQLEILFCDYSQEVVCFPIESRVGYETYSLINQAYKDRGGFLSYKAEIVNQEGEVLADWKHQLFVQLIEEGEPIAERSSAVIE